jgi:hypothetical protein
MNISDLEVNSFDWLRNLQNTKPLLPFADHFLNYIFFGHCKGMNDIK